MPIRFRCVYCNKLLGIARRKGGAVVNCPQCHQPLIVPTPEPDNSATAAATAGAGATSASPGPSKLFERDDFDVLLDEDQTFPADPPAIPRYASPSAPPFAAERGLPNPSRRAAKPIVIGKMTAILVGCLVLLLLAIAFGAGILVGRALQ